MLAIARLQGLRVEKVVDLVVLMDGLLESLPKKEIEVDRIDAPLDLRCMVIKALSLQGT